MPDFIPPMRATLATSPFDDPDWLFEVKWDGYRVEAVVRDGAARLWTRNRQDAARYFPELAGDGAWIEAQRGDRRRRGGRARRGGPPAVQPAPGPDRHPHLARARDSRRKGTAGADRVPGLRPAPPRRAVAARGSRSRSASACSRPACARIRSSGTPATSRAKATAFFAAAREQELEGIVAKLRRSPYEPDRRSRSWLKLKVRREQEVVVVGWLPGQGSHADLGSLILARALAATGGRTPARSAAASTRGPAASCASALE